VSRDLVTALEAQIATPSAATLGLTLARAEGARTLTGERADDEALASVTLVQRVGDVAAVLATSTCGNAWVISLRVRDQRWVAVAHEALVGDASPGHRRVSLARVRAIAMLDDEARELVAEYASESEEGDEARDPALRVFRLERDGALNARSGELAFGGTDDATGAVRSAEWLIEETFAPPRDLYVQVRPARRGPGGSAPPFVVQRTYTWRQGILVLAEEASARLRPPIEPTGSRGTPTPPAVHK
jgi:hypothetical protein